MTASTSIELIFLLYFGASLLIPLFYHRGGRK
jgi:hypothetical protein